MWSRSWSCFFVVVVVVVVVGVRVVDVVVVWMLLLMELLLCLLPCLLILSLEGLTSTRVCSRSHFNVIESCPATNVKLLSGDVDIVGEKPNMVSMLAELEKCVELEIVFTCDLKWFQSDPDVCCTCF